MALAIGALTLFTDQAVGLNFGVTLGHPKGVPFVVLSDEVCVKHEFGFMDFAENRLVPDPPEYSQSEVALALPDFRNRCSDFVSPQDGHTELTIARHGGPVISHRIFVYVERWDGSIERINNIERGVSVDPKGWGCTDRKSVV